MLQTFFSKVEGATLVLASAFTKVTSHFGGIIDPMLSNMIIKDECANPMVETGMEEGISISVHLESIIATVPNLVATTKDLMVDVRVEETKATFME
jgi:hypothetical protein